MEWISLNDKLPEPWTPILFYSKSNGVIHGTRQGGNRKIEWFRSWGTRTAYKDVTHWMVLPQPPVNNHLQGV